MILSLIITPRVNVFFLKVTFAYHTLHTGWYHFLPLVLQSYFSSVLINLKLVDLSYLNLISLLFDPL
jgi:hypothetical protein